MPSKNPPHKLNDHIVNSEQRIRMVQLAIQDNQHFELSTIEIEREGLTYTADTLQILTKEHPENEYYFIMGADSLYQIEQWKEPARIFRLSHLIAAGRDDIPDAAMEEQILYLTKKYNGEIHFLQVPNMDISSKTIRKYRKDGKSIRYYVPELVQQYILDNKLYEDTELQ
jgi:nicotinate-nucleotide adenylyltransferase